MSSVKQESKNYKKLQEKVDSYYVKYQALENFKDQLREQ